MNSAAKRRAVRAMAQRVESAIAEGLLEYAGPNERLKPVGQRRVRPTARARLLMEENGFQVLP